VPIKTLAARGNVWAVFDNNQWERHAQISHRPELLSYSAVGTADFGGMGAFFQLLGKLPASVVADVRQEDGLITIVTTDARSHRIAYTFDPAKNCLPTQIIHYNGFGNIRISVHFLYEPLIPDSSWFMRERRKRVFSREDVQRADADNWYIYSLLKVVGQPRINEPVDDDAFVFDLPPDTPVVDHVRETDPEQQRKSAQTIEIILALAAEIDAIQQQSLPADEQALVQLLGKPMPTTPWGHQIHYYRSRSGDSYRLEALTEWMTDAAYVYDSAESGAKVHRFIRQ
jgi:hypothetical protein